MGASATIEKLPKYMRGEIAMLRGAQNPHVFTYTFRFLRSVRLALYPAQAFVSGF